jgi:hypothetical protein
MQDKTNVRETKLHRDLPEPTGENLHCTLDAIFFLLYMPRQ